MREELGNAKSVAKIVELYKKLKEYKVDIDNKEKKNNDNDLDALKSLFGQEKTWMKVFIFIFFSNLFSPN